MRLLLVVIGASRLPELERGVACRLGSSIIKFASRKKNALSAKTPSPGRGLRLGTSSSAAPRPFMPVRSGLKPEDGTRKPLLKGRQPSKGRLRCPRAGKQPSTARQAGVDTQEKHAALLSGNLNRPAYDATSHVQAPGPRPGQKSVPGRLTTPSAKGPWFLHSPTPSRTAAVQQPVGALIRASVHTRVG